MINSIDKALYIGPWQVEPGLNRIVQDGYEIVLQPRVMDLLCYLARRAGQIVSKEELALHVWHVHFVEESTLMRAVARLRRVLGDDARHPQFVETVHKRGYRLIAQVSGFGDDQISGPIPPLTGLSITLLWRNNEYRLGEGSYIIGRASEASIQIIAAGVSRQHARIEVSGSRVLIEDIGSKNGTFVQGRRIESPTELKSGETLRFGSEAVIVRLVSSTHSTVTEAHPCDP